MEVVDRYLAYQTLAVVAVILLMMTTAVEVVDYSFLEVVVAVDLILWELVVHLFLMKEVEAVPENFLMVAVADF